MFPAHLQQRPPHYPMDAPPWTERGRPSTTFDSLAVVKRPTIYSRYHQSSQLTPPSVFSFPYCFCLLFEYSVSLSKRLFHYQQFLTAPTRSVSSPSLQTFSAAEDRVPVQELTASHSTYFRSYATDSTFFFFFLFLYIFRVLATPEMLFPSF